jgi:hypothetical protein
LLLENVELKDHCQRLKNQSAYAESFEEYDLQIGHLQKINAKLRQANIDMKLQYDLSSVSAFNRGYISISFSNVHYRSNV